MHNKNLEKSKTNGIFKIGDELNYKNRKVKFCFAALSAKEFIEGISFSEALKVVKFDQLIEGKVNIDINTVPDWFFEMTDVPEVLQDKLSSCKREKGIKKTPQAKLLICAILSRKVEFCLTFLISSVKSVAMKELEDHRGSSKDSKDSTEEIKDSKAPAIPTHIPPPIGLFKPPMVIKPQFKFEAPKLRSVEKDESELSSLLRKLSDCIGKDVVKQMVHGVSGPKKSEVLEAFYGKLPATPKDIAVYYSKKDSAEKPLNFVLDHTRFIDETLIIKGQLQSFDEAFRKQYKDFIIKQLADRGLAQERVDEMIRQSFLATFKGKMLYELPELCEDNWPDIEKSVKRLAELENQEEQRIKNLGTARRHNLLNLHLKEKYLNLVEKKDYKKPDDFWEVIKSKTFRQQLDNVQPPETTPTGGRGDHSGGRGDHNGGGRNNSKLARGSKNAAKVKEDEGYIKGVYAKLKSFLIGKGASTFKASAAIKDVETSDHRKVSHIFNTAGVSHMYKTYWATYQKWMNTRIDVLTVGKLQKKKWYSFSQVHHQIVKNNDMDDIEVHAFLFMYCMSKMRPGRAVRL
jgi:hypothetical protein